MEGGEIEDMSEKLWGMLCWKMFLCFYFENKDSIFVPYFCEHYKCSVPQEIGDDILSFLTTPVIAEEIGEVQENLTLEKVR